MKGCRKCRGENLKKEFYKPGYMSASDLGRPRGAKGSEVGGGLLYICQDCGAVMERTEIVESLREEKRRLWIATIPTEIDIPWENPETGKNGSDLHLIEKTGVVTDQWGNYLCELPLDPVLNPKLWISAEMAGGINADLNLI